MKQSANTLNLALVLVLVIGVAVSAFMGWQAYSDGSAANEELVGTSPDTLTVPELKLNATRERQGGTVEVQVTSGRANPFLAP